MAPSYPSRRSTRLHDYDYSRAGAYFVTLCVQDRLPLLGSIEDGQLHLSAAGHMVTAVWHNLPHYYPGVALDAFVAMPNHCHGIIVLDGGANGDERADAAVKAAPTLSFVIGRFKSFTTHAYGIGVKQQGWPMYPGRFWQTRFYDHVIRNERELNAIREYIATNPLRWELDRLNPECGLS